MLDSHAVHPWPLDDRQIQQHKLCIIMHVGCMHDDGMKPCMHMCILKSAAAAYTTDADLQLALPQYCLMSTSTLAVLLSQSRL